MRALILIFSLAIFWPFNNAFSQTLADVFMKKAKFVTDSRRSGFGSNFGMHFLSDVRDTSSSTNYVYYINGYNENGITKYQTNLATTQDGINFFNSGPVLSPSFQDDSRIAAFASVVKEGTTWYMVYEAASSDGSNLGSIKLAKSNDGVNWSKRFRPILTKLMPWERGNIGTPTLIKNNGLWYLFYHGFDFNTLNVGLAVGTRLTNLNRVNNGNPIIRTGTGWDSGTIGKRSITRQNGIWYMVYEGSTRQVGGSFSNSKWSTGLARSYDLVNWEKFSENPILPQTQAGFGNDGPEWIQPANSTRLFIYYRRPVNTSITDRARIVWR
jgi:predicted GH43/DUF377 family glycosyl hydrolase